MHIPVIFKRWVAVAVFIDFDSCIRLWTLLLKNQYKAYTKPTKSSSSQSYDYLGSLFHGVVK